MSGELRSSFAPFTPQSSAASVASIGYCSQLFGIRFTPSRGSLARTSAAKTKPLSQRCVGIIKGVAAQAVRLARILPRNTLAALLIDGWSNSLQMISADAGVIATQVIGLKSVRHWAHRQFIRTPVGADILLQVAVPESSVSGLGKDCARPDPAPTKVRTMSRCRPVFIDLRPEASGSVAPRSSEEGSDHRWITVLPPSLVMRWTPAPSLSPLTAP